MSPEENRRARVDGVEKVGGEKLRGDVKSNK